MKKMRKIIHVDMDAFYASVEIRDNPSLRGKPVIVGGMPNTRGVVCTCSYEARKFGVRSAMPAARAHQLCPRGIFLHPRFDVYSEVSRRIRRIFFDYTDLVEPLSLDEAYLDVTDNKRGIPYATRIAREIKERIFRETGGLTASAGVSFNKFFAKVASDMHKPDGLTVIPPAAADEFLETLPIGKFYGVGKVTEKHFLKMGIKNGGDLKKRSRLELMKAFGKTGGFYYDIARGIDTRMVEPNRERKSLGTEVTFQSDISDLTEMIPVLQRQSQEVSDELRRKGLAGRTVTLKVKFFNFKSITRSRTLDACTDNADIIASVARELLLATEAGTVAVRLLGVTVSNFPEEEKIETPTGVWLQPEFDFGEEL